MTDDKSRALEPAEVAKLEAEAEKALAEAEQARAETARRLAEAAKFEAEALSAAADAECATLKARVAHYATDRETEKRDRELADFKHQHVYHFSEAVRSESCTKCMTELNYWHRTDPGCEIEIMFDSPGGSVFDGLALFDYIQELRRDGHEVTTSTRGMAASMGGILLQAGDKRVMGAEAWILIHEISTITGGKIGEIEDEVELVKKIQERVLGIFADRSKLTKSTLRRKWRRRDWWIDSTEALKCGLVDEVR